MPADPAMFSEPEKHRLWKGEIVKVRGKRFRLCAGCHQAIRVDKPIIGGIHLCAEESERPDNRRKAEMVRRRL